MGPMRGSPPGAIDGAPDRYTWRHRTNDHTSIAVFLAIAAAAATSGADGAGWWGWLSWTAGITMPGMPGWVVAAYQRGTARSGLIQRGFVPVIWALTAALGGRLL
jgi:hypothetical protein